MNENVSDMDRISEIVDELSTELKELAQFIHKNPELGLKEVKACAAQAELLRKYGFEVETPFAGFDTAYKAVYKGTGKGPKIAMLAEYDALPELGHGCGHNLIAMVGVGAGIAMREFADKYGAEIYVFGTPAEETYGGKIGMAEAGAFDEMDVAMMAHPMNENYSSMNTMAMNSHKFEFFGKTAHAAAAPHEGVNALDAVINFFNLVNALRQQTQDDARIHGIITNGGEAPNIIPDYAAAHFYIRANKCAYLETLTEKVIDCAKAAALGTGTRLEFEANEAAFKDTASNRVLSQLQSKKMEELGVKVVPMEGVTLPGSSDLGDVSYVCPSIQCTFDITGGQPYGAHTVEFAKCASTQLAMEKGLEYVKGFVLTAIDLMKDPQVLKAIKAEFQKNR